MKHAEAVSSGVLKAAAPSGKGPAATSLLVEPDAVKGRLLVVAPGALMTEAEMMVAELDREGDGPRVIRTVKLKKADAAEMAGTINAVLSSGTRSPGFRRPDRGGTRRGGPPGSPPTPPV